MTPDPARTLNAIGMPAVSLVLAYVYQLAFYELPCPQFLLQRVGFVAVGVGLGLNLLYGSRPQHYAMVLVAALNGGSVSVRQIMLHIAPETGHYGSLVLDLHYYTWAAICFFVILLGTAIMLIFDRQYVDDRRLPEGEREAIRTEIERLGGQVKDEYPVPVAPKES